MADDNTRTAAARRQRIQMLKKCIILTVVTLIMLPVALCFILLERVQSLEKNLDSLIGQVEMLTNIVAEQREQLSEMTGATVLTGEGSAQVGSAEHTMQGQELISSQDAAPTEQDDFREQEESYDVNRSHENGQPEETDVFRKLRKRKLLPHIRYI